MRAASIVVLIAVVLPFLLGQFWAYQLGLYALYAAAAVGVGLCWGQAGFLPLGQAMFFGLAAYLSGLAFIAFQETPIVPFSCCRLPPSPAGLLAYLIGSLVFRRPGESGAYFSMITLALVLLAFQIATTWNSVTGGFNGLKGIPGLPGLDDISDVYYVSAAILLAVLGLPAGSTTRRSACSGGRWRRTSVACNCSASTPISSKPWRSASADCWPASAARSMRRSRGSSRRK